MNRGATELAKHLVEKGSQARLADEINIDQGYLSKIERAERVPGLEVRKKLKERLGIGLDLWDEPVDDAPTDPPASERKPTGAIPALDADGTDPFGGRS